MPSIVKQAKKQDPSSKLKWFDTVMAYTYTYTEGGNLPAEKIAIRVIEKPACKANCRHTFRSEADAITTYQKKKQCEHRAHLDNMLPDLAQYQWSHLSIDELKAAESEMIEELDRLREVDESTGYTRHSGQYRALEKQLSLMLEMYECLFQKSSVEQLISISMNKKDEDVCIAKKRNARRSFRFLFPFSNCLSAFDVDDESAETAMVLSDSHFNK